MINISTLKRILCLSATAAAIVLATGSLSQINAQRDPFQKPGYMRPRPTVSASAPKKAKTPPKPANYAPPMIEARLDYFKRLRAEAAANGQPLPKVTGVLTLSEMAVTGIFKTQRGYAAVVEATPIKLSYIIYPGEKFFDGQLVAVDENNLVFRKVSKVGDGKFVSSVENKPLARNSTTAQFESTAPSQSQPADRPVETADNAAPAAGDDARPRSNPFLSPLDEMNSLPAAPLKETPEKGSKKPTKVAKTKRP